MLAGAAALLFALAAPSGIRLATPADSGAVSLAVIVVPPGGNFLQHLSLPVAAGQSEGDLVSLVEHRRTFVGRVLAGPHVPGRVTIRQIYPEMASFRMAAVRRLAFLERTASGYWYVQWQIEIRRGRACLDARAIARYRIVIPRRAPDRNGEICFRL
jgi:hypothetical protein